MSLFFYFWSASKICFESYLSTQRGINSLIFFQFSSFTKFQFSSFFKSHSNSGLKVLSSHNWSLNIFKNLKYSSTSLFFSLICCILSRWEFSLSILLYGVISSCFLSHFSKNQYSLVNVRKLNFQSKYKSSWALIKSSNLWASLKTLSMF